MSTIVWECVHQPGFCSAFIMRLWLLLSRWKRSLECDLFADTITRFEKSNNWRPYFGIVFVTAS